MSGSVGFANVAGAGGELKCERRVGRREGVGWGTYFSALFSSVVIQCCVGCESAGCGWRVRVRETDKLLRGWSMRHLFWCDISALYACGYESVANATNSGGGFECRVRGSYCNFLVFDVQRWYFCAVIVRCFVFFEGCGCGREVRVRETDVTLPVFSMQRLPCGVIHVLCLCFLTGFLVNGTRQQIPRSVQVFHLRIACQQLRVCGSLPVANVTDAGGEC